MYRTIILNLFLLFHLQASAQDNVRISLFAGTDPGNALFSVVEGKYVLNSFSNTPVELIPGDMVFISRYRERLVCKKSNSPGIICDSLLIDGKTSDAVFSLRAGGERRYYSGDLHCFSYPGSVLMVNVCDMESYIAGVVQAEGGKGKHIEYFKTQAVIARTYMYKYLDKHILDGYNLCDATHCQVYKGISDDTVIVRAALETRDQVILSSDSMLIISAFHSNCGGMTAPAEDVWLTHEPYLKKVTDPFCSSSRNARWQKSLGLDEWTAYLRKTGQDVDENSRSELNFAQLTRMKDYKTGNISLTFRQIRTDLNLRSAFFSVSAEGDSVILRGRGYGHGVGLCQEGAMVMAEKGFDYRQIISFYYTGVIITDIENAVPAPPV